MLHVCQIVSFHLSTNRNNYNCVSSHVVNMCVYMYINDKKKRALVTREIIV